MGNAIQSSSLLRFGSKSPLRNHGVGALFEAQDLSGMGRVALREIPVDAMGEVAVTALGRLPHHPVLPNVVGSGREGDTAWVALEFPSGKLLSALGHALEPISWARVGASVASALAAAHESDVVHGELTNDSVLLAGDRVLLYDLPLVVANRLTDRRGEARLLAQLPLMVTYLAPERVRGQEPSPAADVYGLGVLLCIAGGSTGAPGETALERIHRVTSLAWRPELPPYLTPQHALINRMLAQDPAKRPSMREVATELHAVLEQLTIPAKRPVTEPHAAVDPFEALIANGVSVSNPDPHAIPTRQMPAGQLDPVPTAPARGQTPVARRSPVKTIAAPPMTTGRVPMPTEPNRAPVPTPSGKRKTPVPPMVDSLNDTGKLWKLEPIANGAGVRPAVPAPQPPTLAAAPAAASMPLLTARPTGLTQPFGFEEVSYRAGVVPAELITAPGELPVITGAIEETPKLTEAIEAAAAKPAPQAYINVDADETDELKPAEVIESDDELAAKLKPTWHKVVIPLAAVAVLGIAGVVYWQFASDLGLPELPKFSTPSLSISSLMPGSGEAAADEANEDAPRRRRSVRPTSMATTPAAPAQAEADAPAEAPKAEPVKAEALEPAPAAAKTEEAAEAQEDDAAEEPAAPAMKPKPAPKPVMHARPEPKAAPAPAPAQKKVAAAPSHAAETPAIESRPAPAPKPAPKPSGKLSDEPEDP